MRLGVRFRIDKILLICILFIIAHPAFGQQNIFDALKQAAQKLNLGDGSNTNPTTAPAKSAMVPQIHIENTPLFHILDDGKTAGITEQVPYPRVALRVVSWRQTRVGGNGFAPQSMLMPLGCMDFSAMIWYSPNKSRRVPAFTVCIDDLNKLRSTTQENGNTVYHVDFFEYNGWANSALVAQGFENPYKPNTGYKRTDGPSPPLYAMSKDDVNDPAWTPINGATETGSGCLLPYIDYAINAMGHHNTNIYDGRLWVVSSGIVLTQQ